MEINQSFKLQVICVLMEPKIWIVISFLILNIAMKMIQNLYFQGAQGDQGATGQSGTAGSKVKSTV